MNIKHLLIQRVEELQGFADMHRANNREGQAEVFEEYIVAVKARFDLDSNPSEEIEINDLREEVKIKYPEVESVPAGAEYQGLGVGVEPVLAGAD